MFFRKHGKSKDFVDDLKAQESSENNKLDTEEGKKKAQSLFSKKFIDYLSSKRADYLKEIQKTSGRNCEPGSSFAYKEYTSSDETSDASCSSWKSHKKTRRRIKEKSLSHPSLSFEYACRSKLIQCNLIEEAEEVIVSEELKPFLMNMTILLQELKETWSDKAEAENVYNLISKITILITEFSRRQINEIEPGKRGDHFKNLSKTMETILSLVNEHKRNSTLDFDNGIREYKRMEKELAVKDVQVEEAKKILALEEDELKIDPTPSEIQLKVKNSILNNERLKAQIKFNQSRIKKYKKFLLEKEWTKHKLDNELVHLRKKISKIDLLDDNEIKSISSAEMSLTNYLNKKDSPGKLKASRLKK